MTGSSAPPYRQGPPLACGRCGRALAVREADIAADGYRCLSCSTDEKLALAAAERRRDLQRIASLRKLRVTVYATPVLAGFAAYGTGSVRLGAALLLVPVVYFAFIAAREIWRS